MLCSTTYQCGSGSHWPHLAHPVLGAGGHIVWCTVELVLVSGGSADHNITVDGERAKSNITHLDCGVMYSMRVVTVAEDGQM